MSLLILLNAFDRANLRKDMMGGVTAAIVSLPLALTFGVASGAGAEAGLYGAIIIGLFAALFGGTPTLISEPTGPMTVVMTAVIAGLMAANPDNGLSMAFTVVMIAGLFQILLGSLRLGRYITLMPYSVISGFMSGIGVILIVMQLPNLLGHNETTGSVVNTLTSLPHIVRTLNIHEPLLGIAALALLFFTPKKLSRIVPPQLIALVVGTLASVLFFDNQAIRRIGEISLGLPQIHFPTFSAEQMQMMLVNGMMLGALGCIDSLLTAVIADSLTRTEHKSDKELIGQGVGNMLSGLLGGLPGAGATMGTVVNIQTGARSAYSGVTRAASLMVIIIGAAQLVQHIPMAVLAAIAIKVGINILDWSFVKKAHKVSLSATFVMYIVLLLTVFVDLIVAVGVGMFIANLITIDRLSKIQEKNIRLISDADDQVLLTTQEKTLLETANHQENTLLVYLSGPMAFGVAKALQREANAIGNAKSLILDLSHVPLMDATISLAIENMLKEATDRQCKTYLIVPDANTKTCQLYRDHFLTINGVMLAKSREAALTDIISRHEPSATQVSLAIS